MKQETGETFKFSDCPVSRIVGVQLGLMSSDEIKNWAVDNLKHLPNSITLTEESGLNDPRLGVSNSSRNEKCKMCMETKECPGHFGRIQLEKPIFHKGYIKTVISILKCICHKCGKLRFPKDKKLKQFIDDSYKQTGNKKDYEYQGKLKKILNKLQKQLSSVSKCYDESQNQENEEEEKNNLTSTEEKEMKGCGAILPTKIEFKNYRLEAIIENEPYILKAEEVRDIFEKIETKNQRLLGFTGKNRPVDLIITNLLIPPPAIRPSVEYNSAQPASQDDLVKIYKKILKFNQEIKDLKTETDKDERVDLITSHVARLMDNCKASEKALTVGTSKKKVKSIKERLKGKEGRFRQHLMGKRVDFSARSVISPDANLALDQLGVPRSLAMDLTFQEPVTQHNREHMLKLARDGQIKNLLIKKHDKEEYETVDYSNEGIDPRKITYGVIVERCLQDNDFVLFNRQPTLHKMSMMGHRIKILPYSTFRLNLSVTTPYNADFDGDEMNMHVPQSYESFSELKNICHVPKQIVAPRSNKPVMGLVQDSLLGIYMFTLRDTFLTKDETMNLIMQIDDDQWEGDLPMPAIVKPVSLWTGKQIISMIIPEKIQLEKPGDGDSDPFMSKDDSTVVVQNGELLIGIMNKSIVGDGPGGLVHTIWLDMDPEKTCQYLSQAQRIVGGWLTMSGFTMSCSDIVPNYQMTKEVNDIVEASDKKYEQSLLDFQDEAKTKDKHKVGHKIMDSFEVEINQILNKTLKNSEDIVKSNVTFRYNNFLRMVNAGSKGKATNLAQVLGLVGQQNIEGARIIQGFSRRTLPHFSKDDHGLSARGFVKNNFFCGLKPFEFFFHTMSGREGLSDTAVKTSRTGYIQRKLVKAIEDVTVCYDGTVRDCTGGVLQFAYGEDSLAGEYIEKQSYLQKYLTMPDKDFEEQFNVFDVFDKQNSREKQQEEFRKIFDKKVVDELSNYIGLDFEENPLEQEYIQIKEGRNLLKKVFMKADGLTDIYLPVTIERLIRQIQSQFKILLNKNLVTLSPLKVYQDVQTFFTGLENLYKTRHQEEALTLFKIHIRLSLSSKKICYVHKLNEDALQELLTEIDKKFMKAQAHPGESVGAISAQSIGEPTTQMTLNTFHLAGVSERNVTLGVPRLQELLDASKRIKTPSVYCYLDPPLQLEVPINDKKEEKKSEEQQLLEKDEKERIRSVNRQLKFQIIRDYLIRSELYYDPEVSNTVLRQYQEEDNIFDIDQAMTPWVLLLIFDNNKIELQIWNEITEQIKKYVNYFQIEHSPFIQDDKQKEMFILFRLKQNLDTEDNCYQKMVEFENEIVGFKSKKKNKSSLDLGGIENIDSVFVSDQTLKFLAIIQNKTLNKNSVLREKVIETGGSASNLKEILIQDQIDSTRTFTNDIYEISKVLGIEAARKSLLYEMNMVFKKYDIYINHRHMSVLIDWMTHRGLITPCNRNGINRIPNVSALRKSSFEETVEILYDSSIFSELDRMRGVTENIMFGQRCPIGTGCFDLLVDAKAAQNYKLQPSTILNEGDIQDTIMEEEDDGCYEGGQQTPKVFTPQLLPFTPGRTPVSHSPNNIHFTPTYKNTPTNVRGDQYSSSPQLYAQSFLSPRNTSISPSLNPLGGSQYSPQTGGPDSGRGSPGMSNLSPQYPNSPNGNGSPNSIRSPIVGSSIQSPSPTYSSSQGAQTISPKGQYSSSPKHMYSPSSPNYGHLSPLQSQHSQTPGGQQGQYSSVLGKNSYSPQSNSPSFKSSGQGQRFGPQGGSASYHTNSPLYQQTYSSHLQQPNKQLQTVVEQEEFNDAQSESEDEEQEKKN